MPTIIGALFGAFIGGSAGLIIGGLLGYAAGFALRQFVVGSLQVAQTQLLDGVDLITRYDVVCFTQRPHDGER